MKMRLSDEHTITDAIPERKLPRGMFFHGGKSRPHALDVHILPKPYADWAENRHKKQNHHSSGKTEVDFSQTQVYNRILSAKNRNGSLSAAIPI